MNARLLIHLVWLKFLTKRPANVFKKRNYNYASANPILKPLVEEGRVNLSFRTRFASKCDWQSSDLTQFTSGYNLTTDS